MKKKETEMEMRKWAGYRLAFEKEYRGGEAEMASCEFDTSNVVRESETTFVVSGKKILRGATTYGGTRKSSSSHSVRSERVEGEVTIRFHVLREDVEKVEGSFYELLRLYDYIEEVK